MKAVLIRVVVVKPRDKGFRATSEVRIPMTWRLPDHGDQQWGELRTRFCVTKWGSRWFH